jgi:hypothetical protein
MARTAEDPRAGAHPLRLRRVAGVAPRTGHAHGGFSRFRFPVFAEDIRLVKFLTKKLESVRRQPARYAARVRTDATHQLSDVSAAVERFEMATDTLKEILEQMPDVDEVPVRSRAVLVYCNHHVNTIICALYSRFVCNDIGFIIVHVSHRQIVAVIENSYYNFMLLSTAKSKKK